MLRDIGVTSLIVGAIYFALLWINDGRFPEMATWSEYVEYTSEVSPDWTGRTGAALGATQHNKPEAGRSPPAASYPGEDTGTTAIVSAQFDAVPTVSAITITGVTGNIDFSDPNRAAMDIETLWQKFASHAQLHQTVSWKEGRNTCYAYYYGFSHDYTKARLIIGYAGRAGGEGLEVVTTESGPFSRYAFDASGRLPDEAWADVYPDGVVLERYEITASGDPISDDAIIIK